jgi:hypothetical protein
MRFRVLFSVALVVALLMAVVLPAEAAKSYSITLSRPGVVGSVELKPGTYKVQVTDSEVMFYRGRERLASARAEVKPLDNERLQNSITYAEDGSIREIRLKDTTVIITP